MLVCIGILKLLNVNRQADMAKVIGTLLQLLVLNVPKMQRLDQSRNHNIRRLFYGREPSVTGLR
jgi:hypothetical protein